MKDPRDVTPGKPFRGFTFRMFRSDFLVDRHFLDLLGALRLLTP
jgi:hypothetical protein